VSHEKIGDHERRLRELREARLERARAIAKRLEQAAAQAAPKPPPAKKKRARQRSRK